MPAMNFKTVICALLVLMSSPSFGQTVKKCDGAILSLTSDRIGKLTEKEIAVFLLTFGAECRNNAEYTEWSNELLFDVLGSQTQLTLTAIENEETIDLEEILEVIAAPLLDEDIDNLMTKVKAAKADPKVREALLDKLIVAKER